MIIGMQRINNFYNKDNDKWRQLYLTEVNKLILDDFTIIALSRL